MTRGQVPGGPRAGRPPWTETTTRATGRAAGSQRPQPLSPAYCAAPLAATSTGRPQARSRSRVTWLSTRSVVSGPARVLKPDRRGCHGGHGRPRFTGRFRSRLARLDTGMMLPPLCDGCGQYLVRPDSEARMPRPPPPPRGSRGIRAWAPPVLRVSSGPGPGGPGPGAPIGSTAQAAGAASAGPRPARGPTAHSESGRSGLRIARRGGPAHASIRVSAAPEPSESACTIARPGPGAPVTQILVRLIRATARVRRRPHPSHDTDTSESAPRPPVAVGAIHAESLRRSGGGRGHPSHLFRARLCAAPRETQIRAAPAPGSESFLCSLSRRRRQREGDREGKRGRERVAYTTIAYSAPPITDHWRTDPTRIRAAPAPGSESPGPHPRWLSV